MFKKSFFAIGLLSTVAMYGNDALLEIKSGIVQANRLLYPKNGNVPLPAHIESAQMVITETMDLFMAYKTTDTLDPVNIRPINIRFLGQQINNTTTNFNKATAKLFEKHGIQDNNNVFLN